MAKKIEGYIKLQVPAGAANPSPPIGPRWVSAASTSWNSARRSTPPRRTSKRGCRSRRSSPSMPTQLHLRHQDAAGLLPDQEGRQPQVGLEGAGQGFGRNDQAFAARRNRQTKMADLNANDIEQATKIIEGSARSMGLEVVEG
jgi:large subunit ribosomal protein L11